MDGNWSDDEEMTWPVSVTSYHDSHLLMEVLFVQNVVHNVVPLFHSELPNSVVAADRHHYCIATMMVYIPNIWKLFFADFTLQSFCPECWWICGITSFFICFHFYDIMNICLKSCWHSWMWEWVQCCLSIRDLNIAIQTFATLIGTSGRLLCFTCLHCHHIRCTRNHQCRLLVCHVRELVVQAVMTQKVCKVINCNLLVMVPISNVESVCFPSISDTDPKNCCDHLKIAILYLPLCLSIVFKCKKYLSISVGLGTRLLIVFPLSSSQCTS